MSWSEHANNHRFGGVRVTPHDLRWSLIGLFIMVAGSLTAWITAVEWQPWVAFGAIVTVILGWMGYEALDKHNSFVFGVMIAGVVLNIAAGVAAIVWVVDRAETAPHAANVTIYKIISPSDNGGNNYTAVTSIGKLILPPGMYEAQFAGSGDPGGRCYSVVYHGDVMGSARFVSSASGADAAACKP